MRGRSIWGGLFGLFLLFTGCETDDPGYQPDTGDDDDDSSTTDSCVPAISSLEFSRIDDTAGDFLRMNFGYSLKCGAGVAEGEVQLQVTNMDTEDPDDPDASAWFFLPIPEDLGGTDTATYVTVDEDASTVAIDWNQIDEFTTYRFRVKLKDNEGRKSNQLEKAVVFGELEAS